MEKNKGGRPKKEIDFEKVNGYNLTPEGIINELSLRDVKYEEIAKWGHFGNGFCWDNPKITNG